jgi:hypothetical protein
MLREIELAAAVVGQFVIHEGDGCGTATIDLPVSKSDVKALGKRRTHVCTCPSPLCPVAAATRLLASARAAWDLTGHGELELEQFPLVPDFMGMHVTKRAVTNAFGIVARASGSADSARITGHSARVTGAQLMARAGISEWRIQVFGRWGSSAVLGYLRDSLISGAAGSLAQEVVNARQSTRGSITEMAALLSADGAATKAALERALPDGRAVPGQEGQEAALADLRQELAAVRADLAAVSARAVPEAVLCNASGKAHVVANSRVTHCGWAWSAAPNSFRPYDGGTVPWCKRCCVLGDRLKRDA